MDRYGDGSGRVTAEDHHVMTADDPINHEPRASEGGRRAVRPAQAACRRAFNATTAHGGLQAMGLKPVFASIFQRGSAGFLCGAERLLLRVSLGHDVRQSRNRHSEPAARLRLEDD